MLFRKITVGTLFAVVILLSACAAPKGSIEIIENGQGTAFIMDLEDYNTTNELQLSITSGDTLQVEVERESGKIALTVSGKNGSEPYTGNDLKTGLFTVTVSETDEYVFQITGENATGKITVKNLGAG